MKQYIVKVECKVITWRAAIYDANILILQDAAEELLETN